MSFSGWILLHAAAQTLRISAPAILHAQRGTLTTQECDDKLAAWSKRLLDRAGVQLTVRGLEKLADTSPPFIVISNHQSLYDIPVWFQALPFSLRMAAKKELFSVPIWGKAMEAAGFVKIDRKNKQSAYQALILAGDEMRTQQISLVIAPEGTRTTTGQLLPFRNGAFVLSRTTQIPILPVAVFGTMHIHKSGERVVHTGQQVSVHILPPLFPENHTSIDEFRETGQRVIREALERISPPGGPPRTPAPSG